MKPLGQLCLIERGGSPRPIDKYITDSPDGINWIKIGDTTESMYITNTKEKIIPEGMKKSRYVQRGDFLLSNSMSFGRPYILDIDGCIHDGWLVIRDTSNLFDKRFLYYFLGSPNTYQKFKSMAVGGVVNNLNIDMVKKVEVPVLSMSEQKEIADSLDKVTALISSRKAQLEKLDLLVKSRFIEMFGDTVLNPYNWNKEPLGKVCDVRDGTHDSPKYYDTGYPLVTSKNLSSGDIDFTDCSLICKNDFDKINERSKVDFGDILMPMIGTVGNPVIVKIKNDFAIKNVALIKFYNDTRVTNVYVQALLKSDYFDSEVLGKVRGGTQKFISLGDIRKLEILVPPIDLQNQFAEFVEQTDKLKFEIKEALEKLETLKKSLMQQYFG